MWTLRQLINFSLIWFVTLICLTCLSVGLERWLIRPEPGHSVLFSHDFGLVLMILAVPITMIIGRGTGLLDGPEDK